MKVPDLTLSPILSPFLSDNPVRLLPLFRDFYPRARLKRATGLATESTTGDSCFHYGLLIVESGSR